MTLRITAPEDPYRPMLIEAVARNLPDPVIVVDEVGTVSWLNASAERFFGWEAEAWIGRSALELIHPDDADVSLSSLEVVVGREGEQPVGTYVELRVLTARGWRLVECIGAPRSKDPAVGGVIVTLRDLTERRRWEVAAGDDARFRALVQHGPAITMLVSADGVVESVSGAITRVLGLDPSLITGRPLIDLGLPGGSARLEELLAAWQDPRGMRLTRIETRLRHHTDPAGVPVEIAIADLSNDPIVRGMVLSVQDITDLVQTREVASRLVSLDALTGLPNRAVLHEHLVDGMRRVHAGSGSLTVAFVDLDRFKPVNDLLGHEIGDLVLRGVAVRLLGAVTSHEVVGRYGGDEFVIISPNARPAELAARVDEALRLPLRVADRSIQVAASVGAVAADADATPESVLTEADAAMLLVKHARQGRFTGTPLPVGTRRELAAALTRGIAEGEVLVHLQPIVDIASRRVVGAEALVRWQHPDRGLLLPAAFLGVAEEAGLDTALGELVLDAACAALVALDGAGQQIERLSVNLSAAQLLDPQLAPMVAATIERHALDPSRICLEVTERAVPEGGADGPAGTAISSLRELAGLGVHVAIDDFGTGGSTLSHLVSLPADELKIDRSFVASMLVDPGCRAVVAGVIGMARAMGLEVVAEGVEDVETADELVALGCTHAQGYLFSRPRPLEDLLRGYALDGLRTDTTAASAALRDAIATGSQSGPNGGA
jgi:diguanylate cyclase (GGDEF)-like protein/PAS domain S-box-containing protein